MLRRGLKEARHHTAIGGRYMNVDARGLATADRLFQLRHQELWIEDEVVLCLHHCVTVDQMDDIDVPDLKLSGEINEIGDLCDVPSLCDVVEVYLRCGTASPCLRFLQPADVFQDAAEAASAHDRLGGRGGGPVEGDRHHVQT